jgi:peptidoglycan/xylan/chitin deacetylase (PgdA/CDA1 family)
MRHRRWAGLDERELQEEVVDARRMIEGVVGRPVVEAACPFGSYNRRSLARLRDTGYRRVYTSDRGTARRDMWLQSRNTVGPRDGSELLGCIEAVDAGPVRAWARRGKLAAKRWR